MKHLILAAFIFTVAPQHISWRKLNYSDFKGPSKGSFAALSTTQINLETTEEGGCYRFKAAARFLPHLSFIKETKVLAHEQLHFDITELFARKINSALSPLQNCSYKQCSRAYQIHDSLIKEWNKFQELYDTETGHSMNKEMQQKWGVKIDSLLSK